MATGEPEPPDQCTAQTGVGDTHAHCSAGHSPPLRPSHLCQVSSGVEEGGEREEGRKEEGEEEEEGRGEGEGEGRMRRGGGRGRGRMRRWRGKKARKREGERGGEMLNVVMRQSGPTLEN